MTTYIAGPMTGLLEFNYPAFKSIAAELRAQGVDVISPTEHTGDIAPAAYDAARPYGYYLRRSLRMLLDCDAVVLLPGWEHSPGARLECEIAKALGMDVTRSACPRCDQQMARAHCDDEWTWVCNGAKGCGYGT